MSDFFGIEDNGYRFEASRIHKSALEIKKKTIFFWRYAEAIQRILEESESSYIYKMIKIIESKIIIEITLCR